MSGQKASPPPASGAHQRRLEEFFYRPDEDVDLPHLTEESVAAPAAAPERPVELVAFRLGALCYGVRIDQVREIVRAPTLTELPGGPRHLAGLMHLRGGVLPVYDLRARLGLGEEPRPAVGPEAAAPPKGARVVVVEPDADGPLGIWVEEVLEVARLLPSELEAPPAGLSEREFIAGLWRRGERLCILLDVALVLR